MTEPIEARLLRLAEAATSGRDADKFFGVTTDNGPLATYTNDDDGVHWLTAADKALTLALSPSTVSRLARAVAESREAMRRASWFVLGHSWPDEWMSEVNGFERHNDAYCAALAALDAEQEGAE